MRFLLPMIIVALLAAAGPATAATPDPFSPSAQTSSQPASPGTAAKRSFRASSTRTVSKELKRLRSSGQIAPATYTTDMSQYNAAKRTLKTLKGSRKTQLSAVIKNLDYVAAKGKLTPSRLPALFLTLETNRAWWSVKGAPGNGARPLIGGSALVWQYYSGQGLQIQWLATFGQANGYFKSGQNTKLKAVLDQAAALATQRAGGIGWEYLFKFGGGKPPWVSGLAQGTGVQVFARAAQKYADPGYRNYDAAAGARYYQTAKAGLGVFKVGPPEGVRVNTAVGAHYLIYSYSKSLRVQNAFTQAVIGLHDYAQLIGDPEGRDLYLQGDAQLRAETPSYDTGAWSKYSQARESDVSYHNLTIGFLKELCKRQTDDLALANVSGGFAPGGIPALDPAVYCATEANYRAYLKTPPVIALKSSSLKKGKNGNLNFSLSKISRVSIDVRRNGKTIYSKALTLGYGSRSVKFKPTNSGALEVTFAATDLAGNKGSSGGTLTVRK